MKKKVLIVGATSGIAQAVARIYASQHADVFLVARNHEKLMAVSADLIARGAEKTGVFIMDANDSSLIIPMLDMAWKDMGTIDIALVAHGSLVDQKRSETDMTYASLEFRTNAESVISCLAGLANRFEQQGSGVIAVIGSVAGDRGRPSNYLYGSAKAAIDTYTSGLRARLFKSGVHVMIIKPGFVATAMTAGLDLPVLLTASPEKVALDIVTAISRRKDTVYTPMFWQWIMLIIRWMPNTIFKRLKL